MPAAISAATRSTGAALGHWKLRRRLSTDVFRQENNGPTHSRNRPMGTISRLYQSASSEIWFPETAAEITGNSVPHNTAKQLASRIRLLNRKLDSRETTLSNCASLLR